MFSLFSRPFVSPPRVLACLLLSVFCLSACNSEPLETPRTRKQAVQPTAHSPLTTIPPASNVYGSSPRLQNVPWSPTIGQPYVPPTIGAVTTAAVPPPAPSSPPTQAPVQTQRQSKTQIALLLPLTGKNASLGQAMLNAAQLAVFDMAPSNFELMPRDTASSAELAARDALASGAQLLIGPLFAPDVQMVKPIIRSSNVNMLTLSTDVSLAEPGVYVMGFAPAPQVDRVVAYAAAHGASRFAAVIPASPYGRLVKTAFESAVRQSGGTIVASESPATISALVAKRDQIDALLLPMTGDELKRVTDQLTAGGLDRARTRLLGTGLWDDPALGRGNAFVIGGWYAAAEPEAREAFVRNYQKTYGGEPPRLATLTYDATALAAVLASRGGGFDRAALSSPSGFAGIDGIFRLTPQGLAERGLAINEITAEGNRVIDPSPGTFLSSY